MLSLNRVAGTADTAGMPPTTPQRVLPVLELDYGTGREPLSPLIRVGGQLALASALISLIRIASDKFGGDPIARVPASYWALTAAQFMLVGAGLALIAAGRRLSHTRPKRGYALAIAVTLVALLMAFSSVSGNEWSAAKLFNSGGSRPRLTPLSNSI